MMKKSLRHSLFLIDFCTGIRNNKCNYKTSQMHHGKPPAVSGRWGRMENL